MTVDLTLAARRLYNSGLVVLPADKRGKRPIGSWRRWTKERPDFGAVFNGVRHDAVCVVCGAASGGLEILDFDQAGLEYDTFTARLRDAGITTQYTVERSQSGGKHLAFRSAHCEPNQKLAANSKGVTIETRGEGGICLIAPSDGYSIEQGDWAQAPVISQAEREQLLAIARSLDSSGAIAPARTPRQVQQAPSHSVPYQGESVADYLRRDLGPLRDALRRAGWLYLRTDGEFEQWQRPDQPVAGKPGGSINTKESYFYNFSSNAPPFSGGACYSPLETIARLDFGGDESAAAKAWSRATKGGYTRGVVVDVCDDSTNAATPTGDPPAKVEQAAPPSFPSELLECGGLIGAFADLASQYAIRPQPEGSFLAGLSCMSYLSGRSFALSYAGTLVTPNLYSLFLAPSGMGKDVLRRVCAAVAQAYNPDESVPESFASVQALQNMISRVRKVFWLHDEFGRDLSVMAGKQTNANISGVITESLKLYSNANNRRYLPKLIAAEAKGVKRPTPVDRPSLTVLATGNPTEFFDATTDAVLRNGYISRFTVIYGRTYSGKRAQTFEEARDMEPMRLTNELAARVKLWRDYETSALDPTVLTFDRAAFDCLQAYDAEVERQVRLDVCSADGAAEVRARLPEKGLKYALLFALSEFGARPGVVIGRKAAEQAVQLVDYEARQFARHAQRFAASDVSALGLDILEYIKAVGGTASLSQVTRKYQRQDKRKRDEALATLVDADYLEIGECKGKRLYIIREV